MENTNPWIILSERPVYQNNWISLNEFEVVNPGGGHGIYGKVHFKNIAVGVLPLDDELNTYLVGQYRFPLNQYSWEIPEGGGAPDIDPVESGKRELLEETGLTAGEWSPLIRLHLSNSVTDEYAIIFLARQLEQHTAMPEETEQLVVKKLPLATAVSMVEDGTITDAMSVTAIQKAQIMILDGRIKK
jgi:NUDIX domain